MNHAAQAPIDSNMFDDLFSSIPSLYTRKRKDGLLEQCLVVDASSLQATKYERVLSKAWLVSLFENSTVHLQQFNYSMDNLTEATVKLINGVVLDKEHVFTVSSL